jgi:hypothetical protein
VLEAGTAAANYAKTEIIGMIKSPYV